MVAMKNHSKTIKIKSVLIILSVFLCGNALASEWIAVDGGATEIDLKQNAIEDKLWRFLKGQSEYEFQKRETYIYQYQAISDEVIQINALCDVPDRSKLSKQFYYVFDGGSCYFQIQYNINTGKFSNLYVNGLA